MTCKILLVDDERYTATLFEGLFRGHPVALDVALDANGARQRFRTTDYNLILMDQRLPDGSGLDLIQEMRRERPHQIAIMITGYADVRDAVRTVREGLFDYLTKPFDDLESLEATIDKALELDRAYREIDSLRHTLDGRGEGQALIGRSPAIERLLQQIRQVAPLDTSVLLEGESGTGKELVARILHAGSPRSAGPFCEVNCGALSEQPAGKHPVRLREGGLYGGGQDHPGLPGTGRRWLPVPRRSGGHEPQATDQPAAGASGAHLPAARRHRPALQRLPPDLRLQPHLATAVRDHAFARTCSTASTWSPCASRRCASDARTSWPLALHFLALFQARFHKDVGPFTPEAIRLLEAHAWPGNVRQLRHAVEHVVALHPGGPIGAIHLDQLAGEPLGATHPGPGAALCGGARARFEQDYLERLLQAADGNVSEAARISGIARQNLYPRLRRRDLS